MRKKVPNSGETRIVKNNFLWIPKTIGDEMRWLEYASYKEKYLDKFLGWTGVIWIDNK